MENLFTTELEAGDRKKAMGRLKVPPIGHASDPALSIKVVLGTCSKDLVHGIYLWLTTNSIAMSLTMSYILNE